MSIIKDHKNEDVSQAKKNYIYTMLVCLFVDVFVMYPINIKTA